MSLTQPVRPDGDEVQAFLLDGWIVRPDLNRICRDDDEVQVEPRVMQVLLSLAERPGMVITRERSRPCPAFLLEPHDGWHLGAKIELLGNF